MSTLPPVCRDLEKTLLAKQPWQLVCHMFPTKWTCHLSLADYEATMTFSTGLVNIFFFICLGWGRTESGTSSEVLLSVDLKVSAGRKAGFITTYGKGHGTCMVR